MPWFNNRDGERLWYREAGCGTPLVLLHGWCMSSAVWQGPFDGLAASFRLIAPDLRGHGSSRPVAGRCDFHTMAADLCDLLQSLDIKNAVLLGWSMGAQVALQACNELAGRLSGLVLVSATPCFTAREDYPFGLSPAEASGMRLKVQRNRERALSGFHARMFAEGEIETAAQSERVAELLSAVVPPETSLAIEALDALASADMRPQLAEIDLPTLLLHGDRDLICLPQASQYLAEGLKSARRTVFSGCGHAPFMTRPEQFNREIISFVGSIRERST